MEGIENFIHVCHGGHISYWVSTVHLAGLVGLNYIRYVLESWDFHGATPVRGGDREANGAFPHVDRVGLSIGGVGGEKEALRRQFDWSRF